MTGGIRRTSLFPFHWSKPKGLLRVAIDGASIHRIHSGQVVLDLQGGIKELVENSLDAGATSIEVRIKDHGLDGVEVIDNGAGIASEDWPSIGLKHHTSKLPSLDSLPEVTTFGFRGEALSALCALCESVTVTTATSETAPMGAIIVLGRDGSVIDDKGRVARPRGTTVSLTGLFSPLPVRRKEFERNAKRELSKALTLLTAYALVPASSAPERGGVRLKVETLGPGKKRNTVLINDGRGSLRAGTVGVWGPKALDGVLDVDLGVEFEVEGRARRDDSQLNQNIKVVGLVSTAAWGQGRSSSDRQYLYVNGRPCDLKSTQKAVNEVYKSFNTHQLPLIILDFQIPRDAVDINVSPDKRTIMLHSEGNLIAALKEKLESFWSPSRSEYVLGGATHGVKALRGLTQTQLPGTHKPALSNPPEQTVGEEEEEEGAKDKEHGGDDAAEVDADVPGEEEQPDDEAVSEEGRIDDDEVTEADDGTEEEEGDELSSSDLDATPEDSKSESRRTATQSQTLAEMSTGKSRRRKAASPIEIVTLDEDEDQDSNSPAASRAAPPKPAFRRSAAPKATTPKSVEKILKTSTAAWSPDRPSSSIGKGFKGSSKRLRDRLAIYASQGAEPIVVDEDADSQGEVKVDHDTAEEQRNRESEGEDAQSKPRKDSSEPHDSPDREDTPPREDIPMDGSDTEPEIDVTAGPPDLGDPAEAPADALSPSRRRSLKRRLPVDSQMGSYRDEIISTTTTGSLTLHFDLARVKARYSAKRGRANPPSLPLKNAHTALKTNGISHAAGISNTDGHTAEAALSRVITKTDFGAMEVLGQFNKGFIIARLRHHCARPGDGGEGGSDDLFIIDQHASDEKFNFETLQHTTVIKAQKLIRPRPLSLTAGDEIVAMENLDILRANGFELDILEDAPSGRGERVRLVAMPVSKETSFDVHDLEQLLHLLSDSSRSTGQMARCSRARAMFAMRACRKSVMIGKSLTNGQMTQLLRNMGTIDQPWNCPHGRPTMRHLTKIELPARQKRRIEWAKWAPPEDA